MKWVLVLVGVCACNTPNEVDETPFRAEGWPSRGLCAFPRSEPPASCERLYPKDAVQIEKALREHLESEPARSQFKDEDRAAIARDLEPPLTTTFRGRPGPSLGTFHVQEGREPDALEVRNTITASQGARWGYAFVVKRRGAHWVATSLSIWNAHPRREPSGEAVE